MNTNLIIGILVALVIGVGVWFTLGGEKATAPAVTEDDAQESNTSQNVESSQSSSLSETFSGTGSFLELMGMGRSLTCDFSYVAEDAGGAVAGTVKVSGGNIRGDFEMQQSAEVYNSHMIQDGENVYTWSETPQGTFAMKMPIQEDEPDPESQPDEMDRSVDLDSDVDYDCRPWTVNNSVFVPPVDIEFMDMATMMRDMMPNFDPTSVQP